MAGLQDRSFEKLRPGFRRWARWSGLVLVLCLGAIGLTYGEHPIVASTMQLRAAISLVTWGSLGVLAYVGIMLLGEFASRRYATAWQAERNGSVRAIPRKKKKNRPMST